MSINFLYPDPEKDKILEELDKIAEILQKPRSPELTKNIRILRHFTRSLFIVSHRKHQIKRVSAPVKITPVKIVPPKAVSSNLILPPPPAPRVPTIAASVTGEGIPSNSISQLRKENNKIIYDSIEPEMETIDWRIYNLLLPVVKEKIKQDPKAMEDDSFLSGELTRIGKQLKMNLTGDYVKKIKYHLAKNMKGFGKIDPLIRDSGVKKIICATYDNIKVMFENELLSTNIKFDSNEELSNFISTIAERYGKNLSDPNIEISLQNLDIKINYSPITTSSFIITKK